MLPNKIEKSNGRKDYGPNKKLWLRLHLTNLCNFDCPGCHVFKISKNNVPFDSMPYEVAEKAILLYIKYIKEYLPVERWWLQLSIYGGEPLLNRPVLYRILKKFRNFYEGVHLDWIVNTNGSLLNEEDLRNFIKAKVDIHMSLDGEEESHNRKRIDKMGNGTFQRVMKAIKLCKDNAYPWLQFDSVADPYNLDAMDELLEIACENKVNRIHLDLFYSPRYPENFDYERYSNAYANAYIKGKEKGISIFASPFSRVYSSFIKQKFNQDENKKLFRGLHSMFPSPQFYADGSFTFGELPLVKPFNNMRNLEKNASEIWDKRLGLLLESEKEINEKCRDCLLEKSCRGGMKRIFRYHTLTDWREENICKIACRAAELLWEKKFLPLDNPI